MSLTQAEIVEKLLHRYDPEDIIELLDISAEELLDRFEDKLINRFEQLEEEVSEGLDEQEND